MGADMMTMNTDTMIMDTDTMTTTGMTTTDSQRALKRAALGFAAVAHEIATAAKRSSVQIRAAFQD
jgi:hypothetical protein